MCMLRLLEQYFCKIAYTAYRYNQVDELLPYFTYEDILGPLSAQTSSYRGPHVDLLKRDNDDLSPLTGSSQ